MHKNSRDHQLHQRESERELLKKVTAHPRTKDDKKKLYSDIVTQTNTQNDRVNNNTNHEVPSKAQRTIAITTIVVRINKRITILVTTCKGASNLNVAQIHRNIFMAFKLIESTVKFFNPGNVTIYPLDDFSSEASKHTSMFNEVTKYSKTSRVYISFKIEPSRSISNLKYGNNTHMENIFDTLVKNNALSVTKKSTLTKSIH